MGLAPAVMVVALCVVFIALAVPLILQKVPPNCVYGFRTRKTISSEAIWYKANSFFGYGLVVSSLASLLVLCVGVLFPQVVPPSFVHEHPMIIVMVPIAILLVASAVYHRTL
jgi:uncharacterized membrane protein